VDTGALLYEKFYHCLGRICFLNFQGNSEFTLEDESSKDFRNAVTHFPHYIPQANPSGRTDEGKGGVLFNDVMVSSVKFRF
jgi:hypothetical protein